MASDPFIIELSKGESLVLVAPATNLVSNTLIDLSTGGYEVKSEITGKRFRDDLGATITGDGKILIDYDTVALVPGDYAFDIRVSLGGVDAYTPKVILRLKSVETEPTLR